MFEQSSLIANPRCPELYAVQHVSLELEFDNAAGYLSLLSVTYNIEKSLMPLLKIALMTFSMLYVTGNKDK